MTLFADQLLASGFENCKKRDTILARLYNRWRHQYGLSTSWSSLHWVFWVQFFLFQCVFSISVISYWCHFLCDYAMS